MEFASPWSFLWILPLVIVWTIDYWKLIPVKGLWVSKSSIRHHFSLGQRSILYFSGLVSFVLMGYAFMGPRISHSIQKSNIEVNDIFLVVDVSRSMLAEDFQPNRLEVAKQRIKDFVKLRPKDRIALILFSEKVFTLLPLTLDNKLVQEVVSEIDIGPLGGGTNIGDAIGLAVARSASSLTENQAIILFTDGVSNVGNLTPTQAAEEAKKMGVKIFTVAIGGDKDARIPIGENRFGVRYQMIPGGSVDFKGLEEIAKITEGKSYIASDSEALNSILSEINELVAKPIEANTETYYEELYYLYFFWGVVLFVLIEIIRRLGLKEIL